MQKQEWRHNNPNRVIAIRKRFRAKPDFREKANAEKRKYYLCNKDKILRRNKKFNENHPDWVRNYQCEYKKRKRHESINDRLRGCLRSRLKGAIKSNAKTGSAVRDLGCSISDLKIYMESKFQDGMSWDNYGNKTGQWSIDHIIPLSSFDLSDRTQFLAACHYLNLCPLWHVDNLKKGSHISGIPISHIPKGFKPGKIWEKE